MSVNVQVRLPEQTVKTIDKEVDNDVFSSRSDAIRTIVEFYEYEKKRMKFFDMLEKRAEEIKKGNYITIEKLEKELSL